MVKEVNPKYVNFIEVKTVLEANGVNLDKYTFLERLSAERGSFCFKIRERVRGEEDA
jgi:hypothetical protein